MAGVHYFELHTVRLQWYFMELFTFPIWLNLLIRLSLLIIFQWFCVILQCWLRITMLHLIFISAMVRSSSSIMLFNFWMLLKVLMFFKFDPCVNVISAFLTFFSSLSSSSIMLFGCRHYCCTCAMLFCFPDVWLCTMLYFLHMV